MTSEKKSVVVILNGPPGVGKDTIANLLEMGLVDRRALDAAGGTFPQSVTHGAPRYVHLRMKDRLDQICSAIAGLSLIEWRARATDRRWKEEPWDRLNGMSTRQLQIKVSEEWVKPALGADYFGRASAEAVSEEGRYVFSDGGFVAEVGELRKKATVFLVRLIRPGFKFEGSGDSRNYLYNVADFEADLMLIPGDSFGAAEHIKLWIERNL